VPCQAFSTAGARRSFEDERGNVFIHYLQIATDLKARYIVIENVRGLLSAVHKPSEHDEISLKDAKGTALEYIVQFLEKKDMVFLLIYIILLIMEHHKFVNVS
jgi:DNA (cytosine-5)-methyltransferase 1